MHLTQQRLYNQHILQPRFSQPGDIVKWMGAIQAQDYAGSLWAIGLRLKNKHESDIEKAVEKKKIVRSWPMRGTLHFVASEDLRWMLKFLTPGVIRRSTTIYRQAGLDNKIFSKSRKLLTGALRDGKQLTRPEIYAVLEQGRIATDNQRGLHILGHLAQEGLICFGPRKGKQQSFVLIDEWLPPVTMPYRDEAIASLALTYFKSHGPATMHDFAWWSGLTLTEVKSTIEMLRPELRAETFNEQRYWMAANNNNGRSSNDVFLLPTYDEYLVAYRDRSAAIDPRFSEQVKARGNGIFSSPLIVNGMIAGVWKRSFVKERLSIEVNAFTSLSRPTKNAIEKVSGKFGQFAGSNVDIKCTVLPSDAIRRKRG